MHIWHMHNKNLCFITHILGIIINNTKYWAKYLDRVVTVEKNSKYYIQEPEPKPKPEQPSITAGIANSY